MTARYTFHNDIPAPRRRVVKRRAHPANEDLLEALRNVPKDFYFTVPLADFPAIRTATRLANTISARAATVQGLFTTANTPDGVRVWRVA